MKTRWSYRKHAIFNHLNESANAAMSYYIELEDTGKDAFIALYNCIYKNRKLFTAKCEKRQIAFDST